MVLTAMEAYESRVPYLPPVKKVPNNFWWWWPAEDIWRDHENIFDVLRGPSRSTIKNMTRRGGVQK